MRCWRTSCPRAPVVADAGYGVGDRVPRGRSGAEDSPTPSASSADTSRVASRARPACHPRAGSGRGRPPTRYRRTPRHSPVSAKTLAESLVASAWKTVRWREGTQGTMQSRFAGVRVRAAHRDERSAAPREPEWLLIEWPRGEPEPTKYWLSSVPETASIEDLVRLAKIRWRIERDYEELKDELGLDHYEGRGWPGFHHHGVVMHRGLRLPRGRARSAFPPSTSCLPPRRSRTRTLPSTRRSRCGLSVIIPRRLTTLRVRQAR